MNNIDKLVKRLAPLMELPGSRISRKVKMEQIDRMLPIEEDSSAMFKRVKKSIESLRFCINRVANNLNYFDEYTAEDGYHIRFRLNCRVIAILIGTRLRKRAKDDCYVFDSISLFNSLPDVGEIMSIYIMYQQFINKIAAKFPMDAPFRLSSIDPHFNIDNLTNEKLQNTINYALNKNLTVADLLTIGSMAEQLRTRKRKRAALGTVLVVAAIGGAAILINKNSKNGDRKILKDKTKNDSESNNTKTSQDKISEDVLIHVEDIDYEDVVSVEDIEERLKRKTSIDELDDDELNFTSENEYLEEYFEREDELSDMTISEFEEIMRREDYGLDDEEMYCSDEEPVVAVN
ncbi:MAG: hypothetical protein LLG02_10960 [Pelosinus sp.]|nr:hypothetical protein [Pelosinus sp.]